MPAWKQQRIQALKAKSLLSPVGKVEEKVGEKFGEKVGEEKLEEKLEGEKVGEEKVDLEEKLVDLEETKKKEKHLKRLEILKSRGLKDG